MNRIEVESSNIKSIGYDSYHGILEVEFLKNDREIKCRIYHYYKIPQCIYQAFLDAESHGKYLNKYIKGEFEYKRIYY